MNDRRIKPQFVTVPFRADSPNGVTEYNGIAKFSSAGIVLEFDSVLLGLVGGEVKEVRVALDEILDVKFRAGIYKFFAQIQLRLNNFAKISQLPNHGGKVKLKIKREDYELARRAVEQISQYLDDAERLALESADDPGEQSSPVPLSVSELFDTDKLDAGGGRKTKNLHEGRND